MRIATFNTLHCASYFGDLQINYRLYSDAIGELRADVVGLNEIRGNGEDAGYDEQTKILAEGAGYPYYKFAEAIKVGGKNPYGNALLSKHEITSCETIPIPAPSDARIGTRWYEDRVILKARLACGLTVMIVHVGLNPDEKELAADIILENIENERCILMGDFNMDPDDPPMLRIKEKMTDTYVSGEYTWPSEAPTRKIDYIFVTKDIKVTNAFVADVKASDHLPYVIEIE